MALIGEGALRKMAATLTEGQARYHLRLHQGEGDRMLEIALEEFLGRDIRLEYQGEIFCIHCAQSSKRSFAQGHCYRCFKKLASCDLCVLKPDTCHYAEGTCREPQWGETHCMSEHWLYLANTSGLKVGLTRRGQAPTRWLDQGATQALPILAARTRRQAGMIEKRLSASGIAEQTQWRRMLSGEPEPLPLVEEAEKLRRELSVEEFCTPLDAEPPEWLQEEALEIRYPVRRYPSKPKSLKFDKQAVIEGALHGVKGQYLMIGDDALNVRSMAGYQVRFSVD